MNPDLAGSAYRATTLPDRDAIRPPELTAHFPFEVDLNRRMIGPVCSKIPPLLAHHRSAFNRADGPLSRELAAVSDSE